MFLYGVILYVSRRTAFRLSCPGPLPLLLASLADTNLIILSEGTRGSYTLSVESLTRGTPSRTLPRRTEWEFSGIGEIEQRPSSSPDRGSDSQAAEIRPIPRVNVSSKESMADIIRQGSPVLIEGLDIGACRNKWTLDYLAEQVGDRQVRGSAKSLANDAIDADISRAQVVVHECNVRNMDFNAKNFRYTSMAFGDFAREVQNGARLYLRALSADAPANQPANLAHDFPSVAADFRLPEALNACLENMHSSVLRVSGQVRGNYHSHNFYRLVPIADLTC